MICVTLTPRPEPSSQNTGAIAISQDPLGIQGQRTSQVGDLELWSRPLTGDGYAFAVLNTAQIGGPQVFSAVLHSLVPGAACAVTCLVTEVLPNLRSGETHTAISTVRFLVNPTGSVLFTVFPDQPSPGQPDPGTGQPSPG
uniref:Alpha-galactosidase A-like n=1 Tax=Callorhinchus milii TaxID=7868 RepID=A0A4W3GEQ5_CALMI|eukprot:gi/632992016/ref/XP_007884886.1/ PREDICTED: alpha-galactosidase A-like [Callorhinchus milii]